MMMNKSRDYVSGSRFMEEASTGGNAAASERVSVALGATGECFSFRCLYSDPVLERSS